MSCPLGSHAPLAAGTAGGERNHIECFRPPLSSMADGATADCYRRCKSAEKWRRKLVPRRFRLPWSQNSFVTQAHFSLMGRPKGVLRPPLGRSATHISCPIFSRHHIYAETDSRSHADLRQRHSWHRGRSPPPVPRCGARRKPSSTGHRPHEPVGRWVGRTAHVLWLRRHGRTSGLRRPHWTRAHLSGQCAAARRLVCQRSAHCPAEPAARWSPCSS